MSDLRARFEEKFTPEPNTGCWLWTAALNGHGYGAFTLPISRRKVGAHRLAYELYRGPIPTGFQIDHLCRVRSCVNPSHLEAVTQFENLRRGFQARGAAHGCVNGHAFDGVNRRGERTCSQCAKANSARHYQKRKREKALARLRRAS